jgi:hypothetical protein
MGTAHGDGPPLLFMVRTADGWKLDRTIEFGPVLMLDLEDAPWRNTVISRALDDLKSGKISAADQLRYALTLHPSTTRATTAPSDRSTPEGAIATLMDAIESGDVDTVADSFRYLHEDAAGARARRIHAECYVLDGQLRKALVSKFPDGQGAQLAEQHYLRNAWLRFYQINWVVDGDVARGTSKDMPYDSARRMIHEGGIWRIQLPPVEFDDRIVAKNEQQKEEQQRQAREMQRKQDVLGHLDRYKTPSAVAEALNEPAEQAHEMTGDEVRKRIAEAKKFAATQPLPKSERDKLEVDVSLMELGAALIDKDYPAAASWYFAEGDDGSYVLARVKRMMAWRALSDVSGRELSGTTGNLRGFYWPAECDDGFSMLLRQWKIHGDRAVGPKEAEEAGADPHQPRMRLVNGKWKIDITNETA